MVELGCVTASKYELGVGCCFSLLFGLRLLSVEMMAAKLLVLLSSSLLELLIRKSFVEVSHHALKLTGCLSEGARSGGGGAGGSRKRLRADVERLVAGAAGHGSGGGES